MQLLAFPSHHPLPLAKPGAFPFLSRSFTLLANEGRERVKERSWREFHVREGRGKE